MPNYSNSQGTGVVEADIFKIGGISLPVPVLQTTITFDPPSLTTGAFSVSSGITVTGVELGDIIELYPPYDMQGIIYQGAASAADTIKISLSSCNTGTIDLASGTWGVVVKRRV